MVSDWAYKQLMGLQVDESGVVDEPRGLMLVISQQPAPKRIEYIREGKFYNVQSRIFETAKE